MTEMNRRLFLKLTGGGAVGLAASAALASGVARTGDAAKEQDLYSFRAMAGLPAKPLPTYATYVLEGKIDLASGSGTVTRTIFAGAPEAMTAISLPGLSRTVQITGVRRSGDTLDLEGFVRESESMADAGRAVAIQIDPVKGAAATDLLESDVLMKLDR